jgi:hypothetical protein
MPIPIPIKSKPIIVAVTDMMIKLMSFFSSKKLTSKFLCLSSPLLFFHRHSYVPTSFAFPFNDKTDAVLLPKTEPEYNFPS